MQVGGNDRQHDNIVIPIVGLKIYILSDTSGIEFLIIPLYKCET